MQAVAKGTRIIDEDGLLSLIRAAPDTNANTDPQVPPPSQSRAQMELNKPLTSSRPPGIAHTYR